MLELSQKSIGFSALQRDAASTQQMFDTVLQRVKETELSGGLQTNNAKILDRAEIPACADSAAKAAQSDSRRRWEARSSRLAWRSPGNT